METLTTSSLFYSIRAEIIDHSAEFIIFVWILLSIGALLVFSFPGVSCFGKHGKRLSVNRMKSQSMNGVKVWGILSDIRNLLAPKSWFSHMYLVGMVVGGGCMYFSPFNLPLGLFVLHGLRRYLECLYMTSYGESKMHLAGYMCGLVHYVFAPLSLSVLTLGGVSAPAGHYLMAGGCVLFFWSFSQQCYHHYILYKLKNKGSYCVPVGGLFQYVCCPHYTTEILLYMSFCVMQPNNRPVLAMCIWVTINLCVVGDSQYKWYIDKFDGNEIPPNWRRIVPFVW